MKEIEILLGKYYHNQAEAKEFIDWAIHRLEEGKETKSLLILASISYKDEYGEAMPYFFEALKELEITINSDEEYYRNAYWQERAIEELKSDNLKVNEIITASYWVREPKVGELQVHRSETKGKAHRVIYSCRGTVIRTEIFDKNGRLVSIILFKGDRILEYYTPEFDLQRTLGDYYQIDQDADGNIIRS